MAGYSGTPLPKKLGIQPAHRVALLDEPEGFRGDLEPMPPEVEISTHLDGSGGSGDFDVILLFTHSAADLGGRISGAARRLAPAGGLWIAWPKKASGVETDLAFDVVQGAGLGLGLVDNKVCAVSETYSGLRFVVRKEDRKAWAAGRRPEA